MYYSFLLEEVEKRAKLYRIGELHHALINDCSHISKVVSNIHMMKKFKKFIKKNKKAFATVLSVVMILGVMLVFFDIQISVNNAFADTSSSSSSSSTASSSSTSTGDSSTTSTNASATTVTSTTATNGGTATATADASASATATASSNTTTTNTNPTCTPNPEHDLTGSLQSGGRGTITNHSSVCSYQVGLASYKMFGDTNINNQQLFDSTQTTIAPNQTITLMVNRPTCNFQIDLFYGPVITQLSTANHYGTRLIDGAVNTDLGFCHATPPQNISVSCSASTSSVTTGNSVTFVSQVSGASGTVSYSWDGTDSLSGNGSSVTKTYTGSGTKSATVRVISGTVSATANCSVQVNDVQIPALAGSCISNPTSANIGSTITWSVTNVSGGTGNYTYSWSGTDGLSGSGSSISKAYTTSGTKNATVVITSGGQSITQNCSTTINQPTTNTLSAYCSVNVSSAQIGDTVTYTVNASGGTGSYSYSWDGTDGLSGNGNLISKSYSYQGLKSANVNVYSGSQSYSTNCSVQIIGQTYNTLSGSCYAIQSQGNVGDTITFTASPTGGNGNYTYSWSGDEGIYGSNQSVSRSYSYSGIKNATVTIYSNGQSITRNCSTQINQNTYTNNTLNLYCTVNPSSAYTGDSVNWTANANGGNGYYTYTWSGTDNMYGNNQNAYMTYNTPGTKYGYVTVYSGGQSITRTCSISVMNRYLPPPPVYYPPLNNSVSLSAVPYTGLDSNVKVILFTLALSLWSAAVTYFVIVRRKMKNQPRLAFATSGTGNDDVQSARQDILLAGNRMQDDLESYARSKNVIISVDALESILAVSGGSSVKAQMILNNVAERYQAKPNYSNSVARLFNGEQVRGESEWTTLNSERVQQVVG